MQAEEARGNLLSFSNADSATAPRFQSFVAAQGEVGDCACGPCAIFNAFQFGNAPLNSLVSVLPGNTPAEKVRALIKRYGDKPSVVARNEPRYLVHGGMWEDDVAPFINDWLADSAAPPVRGERLMLSWNETPQSHLQRVYHELSHSLAAGFPPVVNLQSYAARENFFHHYWKWMDGHFVTVVAVQDALPQNASDFSMWVADSQTGRILQVIVYAGESSSPHALSSLRGKRSGKESGNPDYRYLIIQSPRLETILEGNTAQSGQTICVLQYVAHR